MVLTPKKKCYPKFKLISLETRRIPFLRENVATRRIRFLLRELHCSLFPKVGLIELYLNDFESIDAIFGLDYFTSVFP